ncbi:MAG: universal stress protein [Pseudomonadota bacterium]
MHSKVLVPVDASRNSLTAEEYAIRLNWRTPLKVTLLSVLNTKGLDVGGQLSPQDRQRILHGLRQRAEKALALAAAPFLKAEMDVQTQIETGPPGPTICRVAQEGDYDLLLIAPSGLSQLEELISGSVTRYVLHHCQAPVILVKHSKEQLETQRRLRAEQALLPR